MVETTLKWIKQNKLEFLLLVGILILAAFMRLYKIDQYMTFLGDEGRDALVIKDLLVNHHIPFIGPPTSIGNIYLGPLYYYMMAIPMAIFWLNPVAAAVQVAIIGLLTIFLIYYLARLWFGRLEALIAALLYSISSINILASRSSWNPNPAPFFTLLSVLGFYKALKTGNFNWLILTGATVAATVQMHYLALILVPIFGLLWLYEVSLLKREKVIFKNFYTGTFLAIISFLLVMLPWFLFDFKHNFLNFRAILVFFSDRQTTVNVNPLNSLARVVPIYEGDLVSRYMTGFNIELAIIISILILVPIITSFIMHFKGRPIRFVYIMLAVWLGIGVLGLSLYKQNIYDHYLGFISPIPYLLFGSLVSLPVAGKFRKWLISGILILTAFLIYLNLQQSPLKNPPNNQLHRTQEVAKYVINQASGKPFNFALIAKSNYDSAYQFYLDIYGHKPKKVPFEITDQLFVVCEDPVCDPVVNPKQEISHFGMTKIAEQSNFMGVKIYKLIHNPGGKP